MRNVTTIGIDLAKNFFQVHGADERGKKVFSKKMRREQLKEFIAQQAKCLIGIEACGSSHYWAREFAKLDHEVKIMSAQYVKPYVKTNKNDANDAEAICEAVTRPNMRFVAIKSIEQQDMKMIHGIRERLVKQHTQLASQIRGHLAEYGIKINKGVYNLNKNIMRILEDATNELTIQGRTIILEQYEELKEIAKKIELYTDRLKKINSKDDRIKRILEIPGIGPISASALVSEIGNARNFKKGKQLAAYLGLVPRQYSTGGKERLLGISKRGNRYIRCLLIHGARAVMRVAKNKTDRYSKWINKLVERRGKFRAIVAIANKNARIAWALLSKGTRFNVNLVSGL